jgi:hypothetical protein
MGTSAFIKWDRSNWLFCIQLVWTCIRRKWLAVFKFPHMRVPESFN